MGAGAQLKKFLFAYHKMFVNSIQNRAKQSDSPKVWIADRNSEKPLFLGELCETRRPSVKMPKHI